MARITVEDCLVYENNRFALVQLSAKRTKQLLSGAKVLLSEQRGNKAVVTSLREIAAAKVRFYTPEELKVRDEQRAKKMAERAAQAAAEVAFQSDSGSTGGGESGGSEGDTSETNGTHVVSENTPN